MRLNGNYVGDSSRFSGIARAPDVMQYDWPPWSASEARRMCINCFSTGWIRLDSLGSDFAEYIMWPVKLGEFGKALIFFPP